MAPRHPPYALSSLTTRFTRNTIPPFAERDHRPGINRKVYLSGATLLSMNTGNLHPLHAWLYLCLCPYLFSCQRSSRPSCGRRAKSSSKMQNEEFRMENEEPDSGILHSAFYIPHSKMVGQGRLELPTSSLSGTRSSHLSYWPDPTLLVELIGIEPTTS